MVAELLLGLGGDGVIQCLSVDRVRQIFRVVDVIRYMIMDIYRLEGKINFLDGKEEINQSIFCLVYN